MEVLFTTKVPIFDCNILRIIIIAFFVREGWFP